MTDSGGLPELPSGWVWTTVGEVYDIVGGGTPSRSVPEYWEGDIPWISSADIQGLKDVRPRRAISQAAIEHSATNLVPEGSLIVVTRVGLGKVALATQPLCFSQDSQALIGNPASLRPDYSLYYLSQAVQAFRHHNRGTTIAGVTKRQLANLPFALPPAAEQDRIAAKVEELLTQVDAGIDALQKAKAQLRRYRQAVLKAAFEGKLTEEWREAHRAEFESVSTRRDWVRQSRGAWWVDKEMRRTSANYGAPDDRKRQPRYRPAAELDVSALPGLPEGWTWVSLEQISWDSGYGTSMKCDYGLPGPPVLRIPNVDGGQINLADLKRASAPEELRPAEAVWRDDLLVIRTNGSPGLIGRGALVRQSFSEPHFFASYLIRYRIIRLGRLSEWVAAIWHSPAVRQWMVAQAATTAGQYNLNIAKLNGLALPLPPLAEQGRIVEELERRLSVADQLEAAVEQGLKRAERLRQSILKRAFEGKLVPQDPADEPAAVLLERIRAERSTKLGRG